jgi:hypothetical protein
MTDDKNGAAGKGISFKLSLVAAATPVIIHPLFFRSLDPLYILCHGRLKAGRNWRGDNEIGKFGAAGT